MTTELKIYQIKGEWFYTWTVSSLYTKNPVYGPFASEEEAQEDADRHEARVNS